MGCNLTQVSCCTCCTRRVYAVPNKHDLDIQLCHIGNVNETSYDPAVKCANYFSYFIWL